MYTQTIEYFVQSAQNRVKQLYEQPIGFWASSIAGGAYIGLGILLILNVGNALPAPYQKLAMGLTFAIALILVAIAGAELFTGYAMYMTFGCLARKVSYSSAAWAMSACWLGNLIGAVLVASLFALGGGNGLLDDPHSIVFKIAMAKMNTGAMALVSKAILCNWLVCLALWMAARVDSDVAKCVVIFWCLLAFIVSGFEHSIANMTVLSLAVIGRAGDLSTLGLSIYNLVCVTAGNFIGGSVLVAAGYWLADQGISRPKTQVVTP